jgi:hypothetical protein
MDVVQDDRVLVLVLFESALTDQFHMNRQQTRSNEMQLGWLAQIGFLKKSGVR